MAAAVAGPQLFERGVSQGFELRTPLWLTEAVFLDEISKRGLRHTRNEQFPIGERDPQLPGDELFVSRHGDSRSHVLMVGEALAWVRVRRESVEVDIAGVSFASIEEALRRLVDVLQPVDPPENQVPISFWAQSPTGSATSSVRRLEMPAWSEIRGNHSAGVGTSLGDLVFLAGAGSRTTRPLARRARNREDACSQGVGTRMDRLVRPALHH
jgi:Domain of unknown function (DUF5925)